MEVKVTAKGCPSHWIASIAVELCAWRKLRLKARVKRYIFCVSTSTLENLLPSQLYQTSITNVVMRTAPEIFNGCVQHQFDGNYPWREDFHLLDNSPTPAFTDPTPYFRFQIICEHRSRDSEKQIDFVYFRPLLLSVFLIFLNSTSVMVGRLGFEFFITFHICTNCSPLITSVVRYIINTLANCQSFFPADSSHQKCSKFRLSWDRSESRPDSLENLIERHSLNVYVVDNRKDFTLLFPFPQTTVLENMPKSFYLSSSAGGTCGPRLYPKP